MRKGGDIKGIKDGRVRPGPGAWLGGQEAREDCDPGGQTNARPGSPGSLGAARKTCAAIRGRIPSSPAWACGRSLRRRAAPS